MEERDDCLLHLIECIIVKEKLSGGKRRQKEIEKSKKNIYKGKE